MRYFALLGLALIVTFGCKPKEEGVTVKKTEAEKVAFIAGQGPYSEIGPVFNELYKWLADKGIEPAGPPFGIYYDDPRKVPPEECRYEICVAVGAETLGDSLVQIKEIPEMEVASLTYMGPYEKVAPSWDKIYGWIYKNKYEPAGPGMEIYLNSPEKVTEDSLLIEIRVPIKKK